jgi:hypothetical protein
VIGLIIKIAALGYSAYRYFTKPKNKMESPTYTHEGWSLTAQRDRIVPVVYGQNYVTGNLIYREPTETATVDLAVGICEGEVESIESLRIDDNPIPKSPEDWKGCSFTAYTGTLTQTADARFKEIKSNIVAVENAYVDQTTPTVGYINDSDGYLQFANPTGAYNDRYTYLKFKLDDIDIALASDISSATLRLWNESAMVAGVESAVPIVGLLYEIDTNTWKEYDSTVTWNTKPSDGDLISTGYFSSFGWTRIDVTAFVKECWADDKIVSLALKAHGSDDVIKIASRSLGFFAPVLEITAETSGFTGFRGTAYAAITLADNDQLRGTASEYKFFVKGKKIRKWNGLTYDAAAYNTNPAWVILDLMTNAQYGAGIADTLINPASFKTVADYCDVQIETDDGNYEERFRCDIVIDTANTPVAEAINDVLASFGGFYYYVDGLINLGVDKEGTSAHAFTEDNIVDGSFTFSIIDKTTVPNEVNVLFTDQAADFQKSYVSVKDEAVQSDFGRIAENVPLYAINRKTQASRMAFYFLNKAKHSEYRCAFRVSINNADVAPGDICTVTHTVPGWTAKEFIITEIYEADNDEINLVCEEYDALVYTDDGIASYVGEGSDLPHPRSIPEDVADLALTETYRFLDDGTYIPQIKVTWTNPDYIFPLRYHVYWKLSTDSDYIHAGGFDASPVYIDVPNAATYDVYVQTENKLSGIKSDSDTAPSDQIIISGDVLAPADVAFVDASCLYDSDIELVWEPVTDKDLAFYELRLADSNWGNATGLVVQTNATTWVQKTRSNFNDAYTFYIKARDNTGNYSDNADSVTVTKAAPTMPTPTASFDGLDCVVDWDHTAEEKDFNKYEIKVYSDAGHSSLLRTEKITGPPYVYTYDKNNTDNSGTPIRTVYFRLYYYDYLDQTGYKDTSGTNAAPDAPTGLSVTADVRSLIITWDENYKSDVIGYNVYCDTNATPTTLVAQMMTDHFVLTNLVAGTTYYAAVAGVDAFGEGSKCSAESGVPTTMDPGDVDLPVPHTAIMVQANGSASWSNGTLTYKGTTYNITGDSTTDRYIYWQLASPTVFQTSATQPVLGDDDWMIATYDSSGGTAYPALSNKVVDGYNIVAATVTADKIDVTDLSAINADLGTITAGSLTSVTVQTAASGKRVVVDGSNNKFSLYNDDGDEIFYLDDQMLGIYQDMPCMYMVSGLIYNTDETLNITTMRVDGFGTLSYGRYGYSGINYYYTSGYDSYSVYGKVYTGGNTGGDSRFGVWGSSEISGSGSNDLAIGIYGNASTAGTGATWAGYFADGDVKVENDLHVGHYDDADDLDEGAELVTNGAFASDTGWTKGTGWSIGAGVAYCDGSQSAVSNLYQSVSTEFGKKYILEYDVPALITGTITPKLGEYVGVTRSATGVNSYCEYLIGAKTATLYIAADADFEGTVDNVSLKEVVDVSYDLTDNGGFDSDTAWTKGTGWTIGSGVASSDGSQSSVSYLYQDGQKIETRRYYETTYTVTARSAGTVKMVIGDTLGTARSAAGTYTEILRSGYFGARIGILADADFVGSVDNVIVKEIVGGRIYSTGPLSIGVDSNVADLHVASRSEPFTTTVMIGALSRGDASVAQNAETSRNQIVFPAWRDTINYSLGAKIAAINYASYATPACDRTQYTELVFYTMAGSQTDQDDTAEAMRIHSDQDVELQEELALQTNKKIYFDGKGGNDYIVFNSSSSRFEFYVGGVLEGYVDSSGFVST